MRMLSRIAARLGAPLALWLALCGGARAQALPLLDPALVPGLDAAGQAAYARFLRQNHPRAFAIDGQGRFGSAWGQANAAAAQARALANCAQASATEGEGPEEADRPAEPCRLYARDNTLVWEGLGWLARPPPPGRIAGGPAFALLPDRRFLWWGVAEAAGAYVWAHDQAPGLDLRGQQPPAHLRPFNNAAFEVLRFDRDPAADTPDRAAHRLADALRALREAGYRRIVVGGQGAGGWLALMMLAVPGLADSVVAVAPRRLGAAPEALHALLQTAADPAARVVLVTFEGDAGLPALLAPRVAEVFWLGNQAGFPGPEAARTWRFAEAFGPCFLAFVSGPAPFPGC